MNAGIPDFRSSEGLFQTLKKDNPTLSSGRDLFDASVFNVSATEAYTWSSHPRSMIRLSCLS